MEKACGFKREMFLNDDSTKDNLVCPICLNILRTPFMSREGFNFCQSCIFGWLKNKQNSTCPCSRSSLTEKDLSYNRALDGEASYLIVHRSSLSFDVILVIILEQAS